MPDYGPHCEAILESRHMDVIEMDAASNTGVDNMREIIDSVRYAPVQARYKVYIIDEVHMLSKSAFNALLKTLEEPPPHVKFIFATTEIHKVPVTILSRCQRFDLKRLDAALLASHYGNIAVKEGVEAEPDALAMIARAAEGSVRDGLSLLDQAIAYGEGKVKAADVASMLGLMDRSRIIDLFEPVMAGDAKARHRGDRAAIQGRRRPGHHPERPCRLRALGHAPEGGEGRGACRHLPHGSRKDPRCRACEGLRHGASDARLVHAAEGNTRGGASFRTADGRRNGADQACPCR